MDYKIPKAMEREHEEFHSELRKATTAGGATGKTAKRLARLVHPHFVKEEDFALPPLWLLPSLAKGKIISDLKGYSAYDERAKDGPKPDD